MKKSSLKYPDLMKTECFYSSVLTNVPKKRKGQRQEDNDDNTTTCYFYYITTKIKNKRSDEGNKGAER